MARVVGCYVYSRELGGSWQPLFSSRPLSPADAVVSYLQNRHEGWVLIESNGFGTVIESPRFGQRKFEWIWKFSTPKT